MTSFHRVNHCMLFTLLDVEIIKVLRRLVWERVVSAVRAEQAITDLLDFRIHG